MIHENDGKASIDRRDWMKAAALGGGALMAGTAVAEERKSPDAKKVRGVIFMVSDGMSPGIVTLAEAFSQRALRKGTFWYELLSHPAANHGLMDTASADSLVTDSAAASSSWGCGQRVNNGSLNFSPDGKALTPIAAILKEKGVRTGLVTTATITHATPAGFAASARSRGDEQGVATQYLNRVDVLLGGGAPFFSASSREDGRDLFAEYASAGYGIARSRDELLKSKDGKLLGIFSRGHLPFTIDRDHNETTAAAVPTLAEMTRAALERLLPGDTPFLIQIEGARVDHAAHLNDIGALLWDQLAFDDAAATATAMTSDRDDILIVLTSDHGNANPGLNGIGSAFTGNEQALAKVLGMKASYERLFAEWRKTEGGTVPQLTALVEELLGITLKTEEASALLERLAGRSAPEWSRNFTNPEGLLGKLLGNHTGIGWTGISHTSDPTIVTALGPQSERFSGLVKNTDVFRHLRETLG